MNRTKEELLKSCIEQFEHIDATNENKTLATTKSLINEIKQALAIPVVSGSLPLEKLYQWCKEEGFKVSAEITVRADNIRPIIVECDSISSVEEFAEHIGNDCEQLYKINKKY